MKISRHHIQVGSKFFIRELIEFLSNPIFIVITVLGNSIMVLGAVGFYHLERDINPQVNSFFDAFYWAMITITTVGYGDIFPITFYGRVLSIFMIILGTGFFLAYVALLTAVFVNLEKNELEEEVAKLRLRMDKKKI